MTGLQARFVDILREALADAGALPKDAPLILPRGASAVTRDLLKNYLVRDGWLEDMKPNAARAKISGMLNTLAGKRLIGLTADYIWLAK